MRTSFLSENIEITARSLFALFTTYHPGVLFVLLAL